MGVHERFYGMAMREVEQGIQREDLWVKAMVTAGGDAQKAKVIYLDLLAHVLAQSSADLKKKKATQATVALTMSIGRRLFYYVRVCVLWIVLIAGTNSAFEEISKKCAEYIANTYEYGLNEEPKIYRNSSGQTIEHPTRQQCYDAVVFQMTGSGYEKLSVVLKDMMKMDRFLFKHKYSEYTDGSPVQLYSFGDSVTWCSADAAGKYFYKFTRRVNVGEVFEVWPVLSSLAVAVIIFIFWFSTKIFMKPLRQAEKSKEIQASP